MKNAKNIQQTPYLASGNLDVTTLQKLPGYQDMLERHLGDCITSWQRTRQLIKEGKFERGLVTKPKVTGQEVLIPTRLIPFRRLSRDLSNKKLQHLNDALLRCLCNTPDEAMVSSPSIRHQEIDEEIIGLW